MSIVSDESELCCGESRLHYTAFRVSGSGGCACRGDNSATTSCMKGGIHLVFASSQKGRWRISSPCQPWRADCFSTVVRHRHGSTTLSRHFRDPPEQRILADREMSGHLARPMQSGDSTVYGTMDILCYFLRDRMKAGPSFFEPTWGPPSRDVLGESHQHQKN